MTKPIITTDMKESVSKLSNQLITIQKDKLVNQGTDALVNIVGEDTGNAIGNLLSGNNKNKDSTSNSIQNGVKDVIGGLFGKKKKDKKTLIIN
jgi:hypothetical protein